MTNNMICAVLLVLSLASEAQPLQDRLQQRRSRLAATQPEELNPPDYGNLFYWAAHPAKKDMSDSIPGFLTGEKTDTLADVFFLHPTTYVKDPRNSGFNASVNDPQVNKNTDERTILFQASIFNNYCRVYAPRYRQAHFKNFLTFGTENSRAAFNLAYQDLRNAFEYYLEHENKGRPIVIASHSQGAMHAVRLLQEFFDGKPLQNQLVCAYLVGWQVKPDDFKTILVGNAPAATGCFVSWRSYKDGETDFLVRQLGGGAVCVNPVSWTTSHEKTAPSMHKGAVAKDMNKLMKGIISASIEPNYNILWVDVPEKAEEKFGNKLKNYHVADYNLFWLDVRENVRLRVNAFLKK